jgi:tubulin--tyrosine ligase
MLDESLRPWLIEFNANPCLEISCSVLNRIIPHLIENVWRVAIDPLFPPPINWPKSK